MAGILFSKEVIFGKNGSTVFQDFSWKTPNIYVSMEQKTFTK